MSTDPPPDVVEIRNFTNHEYHRSTSFVKDRPRTSIQTSKSRSRTLFRILSRNSNLSRPSEIVSKLIIFKSPCVIFCFCLFLGGPNGVPSQLSIQIRVIHAESTWSVPKYSEPSTHCTQAPITVLEALSLLEAHRPERPTALSGTLPLQAHCPERPTVLRGSPPLVARCPYRALPFDL